MLDIIGIGESDIDIFLKVDHPPGLGEKVRAAEIGKLPGGIIGNFCSQAVKNGVSCGIVTVLGDDENGRLALADYQERGIDTKGLYVEKSGQTFYCVVYLDHSGEKYLSAVVTDLVSPRIEKINYDYVKQAKYVHMCSMDYQLVAHTMEQLAETAVKFSLDYEAHAENAGFDSWQQLFKKAEIIFINEDGMNQLFPGKSHQAGADKILALGVKMVVLTCAHKGGCIYQQDSIHPYHAYAVENVVDTTGAGDCFNGTFLSCLVKDMPVEEAVRYGAAAAALTIQKIGARTGQPSTEEIENFLRERSQ